MQFRKSILLKKSTHRSICIVLLISTILFTTTTFYNNKIFVNDNGDSAEINEWKLADDIACYTKTEDDGLSLLRENFTAASKSIFIVETSCKGNLNSRKACAVESAARAHPKWRVHVLFTGPVPKYVLESGTISKLLCYGNIKLLRVKLEDFAKDTPVQYLVETGAFHKSVWRVEHASDLLRYLTLFKFGGIYMDSDMIVVKSFNGLGRNWAAREDNDTINSALLSFSNDSLGRKMAEASIKDFSKRYDPFKWNYNGPGVITRVVKKMCGKNHTNWIQGCEGFTVYEPAVFYPVYYRENKQYFRKDHHLYSSNNTYAYHIWNALTNSYTVPRTSPYGQLAKRYCPKVFEMYGDKFGT